MPPFETPNQFCQYIENLAIEQNMSLVDTLLRYLSQNLLHPEDIVGLVNQNMKDKLGVEFANEGYLPKTATLD